MIKSVSFCPCHLFRSILNILENIGLFSGVWKICQQRTRDMRLIGTVAEPGALNCLHAETAGSFEFVGTAVAYIKAFFCGDV